MCRYKSLSKLNGEIKIFRLRKVEYGIAKSKFRVKNKAALLMFLQPFDILDFDYTAMPFYGKIRHQLEKVGATIGSMDLLIASHCLALNRTLVTNNESEFARVSNLKIWNWT
ncbi:MAG: type II toxin-antitoxin system VapC family toxin [Candidatus Marinimicrobia bacterium]|nr:type II toxin-antitoxin system VapC family toxin [Candidatus Neomarinimicrobiota bacterium]MBL7022607.1 type II toxin-antitoxin system VapC family toxin [Candidatus Neomarinimicrobiota bacterium]